MTAAPQWVSVDAGGSKGQADGHSASRSQSEGRSRFRMIFASV